MILFCDLVLDEGKEVPLHNEGAMLTSQNKEKKVSLMEADDDGNTKKIAFLELSESLSLLDG